MNEDSKRALSIPAKILSEVSKFVIGKEDIKEILMMALLAGGHVLIEGLPGVAKTTTAKTFAQAIGGEFKRIQLTPDMLPADITGFYIYSPGGNSTLTPGPIFANIVLADELNRTTPRTQAALLEAMQENQVSIDGVTHPLVSPFMVIASQRPYGAEGTYPLTDVQVDRFMLRVWAGYPSTEEEKQVIEKIDSLEHPEIQPTVAPEEILALRQATKEVSVSERVRDYIVALVHHVRQDPDALAAGPSPRATISLYKGSRAMALLQERDFVIPDDVKRLALPALEHRARVKPEAEMEGITPRSLVERALEGVPVPKIE